MTAGLIGFSCILYRAVITILVRHGKGRVTPGAHLGLAQRDAEVRKGKDLQIQTHLINMLCAYDPECSIESDFGFRLSRSLRAWSRPVLSGTMSDEPNRL